MHAAEVFARDYVAWSGHMVVPPATHPHTARPNDEAGLNRIVLLKYIPDLASVNVSLHRTGSPGVIRTTLVFPYLPVTLVFR